MWHYLDKNPLVVRYHVPGRPEIATVHRSFLHCQSRSQSLARMKQEQRWTLLQKRGVGAPSRSGATQLLGISDPSYTYSIYCRLYSNGEKYKASLCHHVPSASQVSAAFFVCAALQGLSRSVVCGLLCCVCGLPPSLLTSPTFVCAGVRLKRSARSGSQRARMQGQTHYHVLDSRGLGRALVAN